MHARLFPASTRDPRTAFSFNVLKHFHLHNLESKKAAYDYLGAIRRLTDNAFTADVAVSGFRNQMTIWSDRFLPEPLCHLPSSGSDLETSRRWHAPRPSFRYRPVIEPSTSRKSHCILSGVSRGGPQRADGTGEDAKPSQVMYALLADVPSIFLIHS